MILVRQHIKTEWVSSLIWAAVLCLMPLATVLLWDSLRQSGTVADLEAMLSRMPESMQGIYGITTDIHSLNGWLEGMAFGGWLQILYVIYVALFVAGILTREMDRRTMEFLLSLPVTRMQVLLSRWAVLAGSLLLIEIAHVTGVWVGVRMIGETADLGAYAVAGLNSLLLYLALGGFLLAVSILVDDYGKGVGLMIGLGLGSYIAYSLSADLAGPVANLRGLLPFAYYDANRIIGKGEIPWSDMAVLLLAAVLFLALAVALFRRKQITV